MRIFSQKNGFLIALLTIIKVVSAEPAVNLEEKLMLASNKIKEACFNLKQNEQIKYSFKASDPIKFNIHYHIDNEVFYPVADQLTPGFKTTTFAAPSTQHYCLMWSNPHKTTVTLGFNIRSTE